METSTTFPRTVGMDISDKHIHLYVIELDEEVSEARIAATKKAVTNWFSRMPTSRVALEVGTHCSG
jgi:hypothetical protein